MCDTKKIEPLYTLNLTKDQLDDLLSSCDIPTSVKELVCQALGLKKLDHTYVYYINEKSGHVSRKFNDSDEIHELLKKRLGEWTMKNADKWSNYTIVEVKYTNEVNSYCW